MHSRIIAKKGEFGFRLRNIQRRGLIAVGALVAFAVFLSVEQRKGVQTITAQSIGSVPNGLQQISADSRNNRVPAVETTYADSIRSLLAVAAISRELWSISNEALAHPPSRPVAQDAVGDIEAKQAKQNLAGSDAETHASFVGIWAPDTGTCSVRNFREGSLPAVINAEGAWAGETFCLFKSLRRTKVDWRVVANCSSPNEHWTTDVRLSVKANRLIWKSERGTQSYTRCVSEVLMTDAR